MRRRLISVLGGVALMAGSLSGFSDPAAEDAFAATIPTRGHGSGFDDSYLVMPHRAVTLEQTEIETSLSELDAKDLDLGDGELDAADGHEFVVLHLSPRQAPYGSDDGQLPAVEITTEGATHDVSEYLDDSQAEFQGVMVAVSVPEDSPVALSITDEDKTATLDVRTGEVSDETAADAPGAYYVGWSGEMSGELSSSGVLGPSDPYTAAVLQPSEVSVPLGFDGATVSSQAWLNGTGWAPAGQTFMFISKVTVTEQLFGVGCYGGWDPATAITFTPDGGAAVPPVAVTAEKVFDFDSGIAFPVPVETTSGALTMTPQSTTSDNCQFYEPLSSAQLPVTL